MGAFDEIFSKDGLIKAKKEDYVPRESQIRAAYDVYDALRSNKHFILEGPCGFGKTFAYLVPVFERHHGNSKLRTVIVTDGISLQEQLVKKDLPVVNDIFRILYSQDISFALLKGKGNFICTRKYERTRDAAVQEKSEQMTEIVDWVRHTKTGDLSELNLKPDAVLHNKISCTQEGECDGKQCNNYEDCFYQKHKIKAQSSNIIVTNYHVLFSDWKIGAGTLLPKYDIAVFDEAHEFSNKFREFRVKRFSTYSAKYIKSDITEFINDYPRVNRRLSDDILDTLDSALSLAGSLCKEMDDYCLWLYNTNFHDNPHSENVIIDAYTLLREDQRSRIIRLLEDIQYSLSDVFESLNQYIAQREGEEDEDDRNKYRNTVGRVIDRLAEFSGLLRTCDSSGDSSATVHWLDKSANYGNKMHNEQRIAFCYKPINVANDIKESFLSREDLSCVFTSATLSTNGNFEFIKEQTGISLCPTKRVVEFIGESPFNLNKQQFWFVPKNSKSAKEEGFVEALPMQIEQIVGACQGGALCLFTSNVNMNKAYGELVSLLESKYGINSLLQGQKPTNKLVAEFSDDIDSVLFATKSFFTGIDVPGEALRCLIIDKLPFPHLNDPVMTKLKMVLGFNEMFTKHSIPMMLITLKQAIGRGVRSVYDKCVISILDNRFLTERSYRGVFKTTFPWNRGSNEIQDVVEFLFPEKGDYYL